MILISAGIKVLSENQAVSSSLGQRCLFSPYEQVTALLPASEVFC